MPLPTELYIQSAKTPHMLRKNIALYITRKRALHSAKKALHVLQKTDAPQKRCSSKEP